MAPALPVGERGFRQVPVSWAALKQAAACQWAVSHGAVTKAQGASKCFNDNQREPVTEPHLSSSRPMRPVRWRPGLRSPDVRAGPYRGGHHQGKRAAPLPSVSERAALFELSLL